MKAVTSDHDLLELAKKLHVRIDGVLTVDDVTKPLTKGTYIILLRAGPGVGHWVCVSDGSYFDPTGVGPPTKVGALPYSEFQYQGTYDEYCGVWCLLYLYSRQRNRPELMRGFRNLDVDAI